jgi:hypothetical protein
MFGFQPPTPEIAETVIAQIKNAGLDGIAVTDHWRRDWGTELYRVAERHFPGEVLIIPGQEIDVRPPTSPFDEYHCVELYLPGGRLFRNYCHPGYYTPNIIIEHGVQGIEIANHHHDWHIRRSRVEQVARQYDLLTFSVSDANMLGEIGAGSTEIDWDEMIRRAVPLD